MFKQFPQVRLLTDSSNKQASKAILCVQKNPEKQSYCMNFKLYEKNKNKK